jgi:uncharacterized protein YabN with tetrapyrrole methylase and pyrophosphatase domain
VNVDVAFRLSAVRTLFSVFVVLSAQDVYLTADRATERNIVAIPIVKMSGLPFDERSRKHSTLRNLFGVARHSPYGTQIFFT